MTPAAATSPAVSVPSKLFVFGEYSILEGGTAVVAAMQPYHTYFVSASGTRPDPHPESPLGRWLADFATDLDPAKVPGPWNGLLPVKGLQGLGTSTAELVAAWSAQKVPASASGLLAWYRNRFPRQSGADLAVQLEALGDGPGLYEVKPLAGVDGATFSLTRLKTGRALRRVLVFKAPEERKLATHESLKAYSRVKFDSFKLEFFEGKLRKLLADDETSADWKLLTEWAQDLSAHGLESAYGREVREALLKVPGVLGAKGCGAGLNDLFIAAVSGDYDVLKLREACGLHGLRPLGSLADLTAASDPVRAFAPVNIAWIKYMGKEAGRATNPSYSVTLDHIGTLTEVDCRPGPGRFEIHWNAVGYVPPESGREKIEKWLRDERIWVPLLTEIGYEAALPTGEVRITSWNSAPAATGIATSASGFAALALAWSACLIADPARRQDWITRFSSDTPEGAQIRAGLAQAASRGSGSAGRSIEGPWVEWTQDHRFVPHRFDTDWVDCVLMLEREPKKVTSSHAHERVRTSPHFAERMERLPARIREWKEALERARPGGDLTALRKVTLEETLDMHHLFHTSVPPFTYLNEQSKRWIELARNPESACPSREFVVTLDAGANVHWFVRPRELKLWRTWFRYKDPKLEWIEGRVGTGARYA